MSTRQLKASSSDRNKASVRRSKEPSAPKGASKVLAERNQAVVAVGAWVEGGQDFLEHPSTLASLTEEIQAEKRRQTEERLLRFQDEVCHRVAQQAQVNKRRLTPQTDSMLKPDRRIPPQQHPVWTRHVSAGERLVTAGGAAQQRVKERSAQETSGGMRQVRLRLAACRMIPHGETTSDLPGGEWNISQTRHKAGPHVLRAEEEEEEEEDHHLFTTRQHECLLVQQKAGGPVSWDSDQPQPDPGSKSDLRVPAVLWPLTDQEELKRQHQSQFLKHRRFYMNIERERVKENKVNRKHLKRTARIKAEKEQIRLEEERKMERARQLAEAKQRLEEREMLVVERLKLEEERAEELQRSKREEKGRAAARFVEALRAQTKERLSQMKQEPPPLCCCASSFWDSHPDTCANNCVFHNNPKEYARALHSTMLSLVSQ